MLAPTVVAPSQTEKINVETTAVMINCSRHTTALHNAAHLCTTPHHFPCARSALLVMRRAKYEARPTVPRFSGGGKLSYRVVVALWVVLIMLCVFGGACVLLLLLQQLLLLCCGCYCWSCSAFLLFCSYVSKYYEYEYEYDCTCCCLCWWCSDEKLLKRVQSVFEQHRRLD